jgi:hypothetical protein
MTKIRTEMIDLICRLLNEGKSRKEIMKATGMKESRLRYYIFTYIKIKTLPVYEVSQQIQRES